MGISVSQLSKTTAVDLLMMVSGVLAKGRDHADAQGLEEAALLNARLVEDMHTLTWQVEAVCDLSRRGITRLAGDDPDLLPKAVFDTSSFDAMIAQVDATRTYVVGADDAALDASLAKDLVVPLGSAGSITMTGEKFATAFLLPNLYFHATMVYALLRSEGVALGKRDYLTGLLR